MINAGGRVRSVYFFYSFWLACASMFLNVVVSLNLKHGYSYVILPFAVVVLAVGAYRALHMGLTIDESTQRVIVNNWMKTHVVTFSSITSINHRRTMMGSSPRGGQGNLAFMPTVEHDGAESPVAAATGEHIDGPIHMSLLALGRKLSIPVLFE